MVSTKYILHPNEVEHHSGAANKLTIWGSTGGKLVLTDQRVLFTNRRKTIVYMEIPLATVLNVGVASSACITGIFLPFLLFLTNAIRITLNDGSSQRFVVFQKHYWIDAIQSALPMKVGGDS